MDSNERYDVLKADMMCRAVHETVILRIANVALANDAADDADECIVNDKNFMFYSNFCVDLTEKYSRQAVVVASQWRV